jgi:hypothetical protein
VYLDPQNGADASGYFGMGVKDAFGYFRMDDKQITSDINILKSVVEVR